MRTLEPIPAIDTFTESDWRIKRDTVDGVRTVRVLAGYESPEGNLDPEQARGYWFDDTGLLLKTYFKGIETRRSEFVDFAGVKIAHRVDVRKDGGWPCESASPRCCRPGRRQAGPLKFMAMSGLGPLPTK